MSETIRTDTARENGQLPQLSGWGRVPVPGYEVRSEDLPAITRDRVLSRGLGRAYGDAALPPPGTLEVAGTVLADRILAFDRETGILRAEAGLSLAELNRLFLRQGWFTPVSTGTQFVTLGGMVAADVHGKNHHKAGCFGEHVRALKVRLADNRIVECSPEVEPDLFRATLGGMGLTGHILEVEFPLQRISSPWIYQETQRVPDIESFIEELKRSGPDWPYTMGWIDCLARGERMGRGILMRGRWCTAAEAPHFPPPYIDRQSVPFEFPGWVLSPLTVKIFNFLYYWKHLPRFRSGLCHPEKFFYPLDAVENWNRIYGARGFTQYQCVIPEDKVGATRRFLELLTSLGGASFLCVIKDCGPEGRGLLSFPKPGISIALDIPIRDNTQDLVDRLNQEVIEAGGRVYLAKDGFTRAEDFCRMEPRLDKFLEIRRKWDPERRLKSALSVRLMGDQP